ncbi:hydrolase [Gracilibacillus oryzae]|uniref:Hydrolase n=1 Tax=Gracilibacillus oryzae TaxID=1672701 RepID=A0A7C8GUI6_9BACI|nr:hydrolase [Gracilibacillus oryzae]KAB8138456.1 hydrolase [Gracilibacillus oryzae]
MNCKFIIIFGLILCLAFMDATRLHAEQRLDDEVIDIIFLNLPDGEATLIKTESGDNILVNTGAKLSYKELLIQLKELMVTEIDQLIVTSSDEEYAANIEEIRKKFHVKKFLLPDGFLLDDNNLNIQYWKDVDQYTLSKRVTIKNIDENANGDATFVLQYGEETVLFLNDKNIAFEEKLYPNLKQIDIVKIAAFGSGNSPSQRLLQQLDPYIGIIFHSPEYNINEDLVERLFASWIDAYFLKQTGSIYIRLSVNDYELLS